MMKIVSKNKRNFFKLSSVFFLNIFLFKVYKLNFFNAFKISSNKFFKRNKKIWILKDNDIK